MQRIRIKRSRMANLGLALLFALISAILAFLAHSVLEWLMVLLLVAILSWGAWRRTAGLGKEVTVFFERGWIFQEAGKEPKAITGIRGGLVGPSILTAEIGFEGGNLPVLAPADATSAREHWQLRRLVLSGVSPGCSPD